MTDRPDVSNPPGLRRLHRRVTDHGRAMARMREVLADDRWDAGVRALARHDTDDPGLALLDAWAVVADTVSFYSERIAHEGLLATATRTRSVRELARMIGYELRPGLAARVDLAFTADSGPLAPEVVTVAAGTPVQSVPEKAPLADVPVPAAEPQTFETIEDLAEVRAAWNALPVLDEQPQALRAAAGGQGTQVWLRGPVPMRAGDPVLVVSRWSRHIRAVAAVQPDHADHPGWTRLELDGSFVGALTDAAVYSFAKRVRLFGFHAPDPNLLRVNAKDPPGSETVPNSKPPALRWACFGVAVDTDPRTVTIELDGDHPDVRPGSWLVLQQGATVRPCEIEAATPGGAARYALSGPVTRVRLRTFSNLREFSRREVTVFCVSTAHPATRGPLDDTVSGDTLTVGPHEPALPPRRRVLVVGQDTSGAPRATTAVVSSVTARATGRMVLKLTEPLSGFGFRGLTVLGNVATATHGETVEQVLGSGDGSTAFAGYPLRRSPLTHVRAATPEGCRPELEVRVDGVLWQRVADLAGAGAHERVYTLREREDGTTLVGFGDGVTGARPSTGVENIVARYRVGIGEPGAVAAGRVVVLTRRPLGLRDAVNPAPTGDYEASESMADARSRAPGTVRTLDRVVSLVDHEHFAAGYAGVGAARADLVWDGRRQRVAVTVLGAHGTPLSPAGRAGLAEQLDRARDPVSPLDVLGGEAIPFRVTVALKHDPARERTAVLTAAEAALRTAYGPGTLPFAEPVTASDVLVTLKEVPGVAACAMPVLSPPSPAQARPAGWSGGSLPAQVLYLDTVTFEELT